MGRGSGCSGAPNENHGAGAPGIVRCVAVEHQGVRVFRYLSVCTVVSSGAGGAMGRCTGRRWELELVWEAWRIEWERSGQRGAKRAGPQHQEGPDTVSCCL